MKKIKTYSRKKFSIKFSIWELNPISAAHSFNIPHEACKPFDFNKFFNELEKEYNLLHIAEEYENYSYS